jgi:hypothetical protein
VYALFIVLLNSPASEELEDVSEVPFPVPVPVLSVLLVVPDVLMLVLFPLPVNSSSQEVRDHPVVSAVVSPPVTTLSLITSLIIGLVTFFTARPLKLRSFMFDFFICTDWTLKNT